jgi:hypothetical protein
MGAPSCQAPRPQEKVDPSYDEYLMLLQERNRSDALSRLQDLTGQDFATNAN